MSGWGAEEHQSSRCGGDRGLAAESRSVRSVPLANKLQLQSLKCCLCSLPSPYGARCVCLWGGLVKSSILQQKEVVRVVR